MTAKKIIGIILATIFGLAIFLSLFISLFVAFFKSGHSIGVCVTVALSPFVGTAIICGLTILIVNLLMD